MAKIIKSSLRHAQRWRDSLKFIDYSYEEFILFMQDRNEKAYITEKLDGELNALIYKRDSNPYFITKSGVIHNRDYPVLKEYKKILKCKLHTDDVIIPGELKSVDAKGNLIPFFKSQSIIRTGDVNLVHHFPFDIYRINSEYNTANIREVYNYLPKSAHIQAPNWKLGTVDDFISMWDIYVNRQGGEGLVVSFPSNLKIKYRIKNVLTMDAVVVAIGNEHGKAWSKGEAGYLKLALVNEDGNFIFTSKVGTGFKRLDREYFYGCVKEQGYVDKISGDYYISPKIIVEIKYRRHRFGPVDTFQYIDNIYIPLPRHQGAMVDNASFVRIRQDKRVSYKDLSINQLPRS